MARKKAARNQQEPYGHYPPEALVSDDEVESLLAEARRKLTSDEWKADPILSEAVAEAGRYDARMDPARLVVSLTEIERLKAAGILTTIQNPQQHLADVTKELRAVEKVPYERAAFALDVTERHVRNLVRRNKLTSVGGGHFKRITSKSILEYLGESLR